MTLRTQSLTFEIAVGVSANAPSHRWWTLAGEGGKEHRETVRLSRSSRTRTRPGESHLNFWIETGHFAFGLKWIYRVAKDLRSGRSYWKISSLAGTGWRTRGGATPGFTIFMRFWRSRSYGGFVVNHRFVLRFRSRVNSNSPRRGSPRQPRIRWDSQSQTTIPAFGKGSSARRRTVKRRLFQGPGQSTAATGLGPEAKRR